MTARIADPDEVVRLVRDGMSVTAVAARVGVSRQRVSSIWHAQTGTPVRSVRVQRCGCPAGQPHDHVEAHHSVLARTFWLRVHVDPDGCWLWTGAVNPITGYGQGGGALTGETNAHRAAYRLMVGPIPKGLQIDHLCRVRACVNPQHLEAVTPAENVRRGKIVALRHLHAKAELRTTCRHGHPKRPRSNGQMYCPTCDRAYRHARYHSRKELAA